MLLTEIGHAGHVRKNGGMFAEIMHDYISFSNRHNKKYNVEGKIGRFEIRSLRVKPFSSTYLYYTLFDTKRNCYAAAVTLDQFGRNARSWQVASLGVETEYQGMNLSVMMYSWMITKNNLILITGMEQSAGGKLVWERLAQVPGIFIFGYDVEDKKSFQVDQNDLFNEDVYADELINERDYLEKEYNRIENQLDNLDPDVVPESKIKALEKTMNDLSAQINSLDTDITKVEDYIRLVAIKKH